MYLYLTRTFTMKPSHSDTYYKLLSSVLACTFMIGLLTHQVLCQGLLTKGNLYIYYLMRELRSPYLEPLFVQISLFNSLIMGLFWGIISLYLIFKRDFWRARHWILLGLLLGTMTLGLKYSTCIARPGAVFPIKDAFPSAHVSASMTLLGGIILLLNINNVATKLWVKRSVYIAYSIWLYLMAFARLYLAAHWLTDILGGVLVSCISLGLFSLSYYRRSPTPINQIELTSVSLGSLAILWIIRFFLEYERILKFYLASY